MASRVNVKFVVILSVALVALAALAGGAFVYVQRASGPRLIRLGDQAMARGDFKAADVHYSKAVNKQRTNVEWLTKWREAREKRVPESRTVFESEYGLYVHGILRQLAVVQKTNVGAHREYLEAIYQQLANLGGSRDGWQHLLGEAETSLKYLEPDAPGSVRRYRGLAIGGMLTGGLEVAPERVALGLEDLKAAVAADPKDVAAAVELAAMHMVLSERARADQQAEVAEREMAAVVETSRAMLAANPDHPRALLSNLALEVNRALQASRDARGAEATRLRAAALDGLRPELARVGAALRTANGGLVDSNLIFRFMGMAVAIDPSAGLELATGIAEESAAANPDDAEMLLALGRMRVFAGRYDDAIATYERVAALPDEPVGLEGLKLFALRQIAEVSKTDAAVSAAVMAKEEPERTRLLDRAKKFRAALGQQIAEESTELAFIDGKILFLEGDYRGAQRKLDPLLRNERLSRMHALEGMRLMADIGQRVQPPQPGLTREYLRKAIELQPGVIDLRMSLANLEAQLNEDEAAMALFEEVLRIDPDHAAAKQQLAIMKAKHDQGEVEDPVVAKLIEVEKLLKGDKERLGDEAAARAALEAALEPLNYDLRLVNWLTSLKVGAGDTGGALAVLKAARAKQPEDESLRTLEERVRASTTLEGTLALLAASGTSGVDLGLAKYRSYQKFGKPAEAAATLKELTASWPEDARVLELRFLTALGENKLEEAREIVQRAVATDADRAEGDTFRARLLLQEGNTRDAVTMLERAIDRGNANAAIFRLHGLALLRLGRGPEAAAALKRALELNPGDLEVLRSCIGVMVQMGDTQGALAAARASDAARRDPMLRNAWLSLEAQAGNTQFVRELREQILERTPGDIDNGAALADLYISERLWEEARTLIDRMRGRSDGLRLVALDAGWHAAKGDWGKGRQLFIDHITKLKDAKQLAVEPFMVMAQFLLRHGQADLALEALRNAAPLQDPALLPVDLAMAELNLMTRRYGPAEDLYRKAVGAGVPDNDLRIRKRLIESMLQQGKYSEVESEFRALADKADADPELMCQRAEALRLTGDLRGARELLDRAVARHPQDPLPYYRRARLLLTQREPLMSDVQADLASAIRLRRGYMPALRTRAMLWLGQGRSSEAITDMRAALEANPGNDQILRELLQMLVRDGQTSEAVRVADGALKGRPGDTRLVTQIGEVFAGEKAWPQAAAYYQRAWEHTRGELDAGRYVAALLEASPARTAEAEAVLATPALNTAKSADLLMARAAVRKRQGKIDQARADAVAALQLSGRPEMVLPWTEQVRRIFTEPGGALQVVSALTSGPAIEPWLDLARASVLLDAPETRAEGVAILRRAAAPGANNDVRLVAIRMLSGQLSVDKNWQEALDVTRQGLAIAPEDLMLTNNAAFFLAEGLNKGAEAVPLAEKAAAAAPGQGAVLETLAVAYWAAGERTKAMESLERALRSAASDLDRLKWIVKLGEWRLESGDREGAERAMQMVRDTLIDAPSLAESAKEPVEAFQKKLGAS